MAKQVECKSAGLNCPFMLRTDNEDELVSFAQQHVKKAHNREVSRQVVLKYAKDV